MWFCEWFWHKWYVSTSSLNGPYYERFCMRCEKIEKQRLDGTADDNA